MTRVTDMPRLFTPADVRGMEIPFYGGAVRPITVRDWAFLILCPWGGPAVEWVQIEEGLHHLTFTVKVDRRVKDEDIMPVLMEYGEMYRSCNMVIDWRRVA